MKQLLGDSLTLRDYDGQVAEAMAMVRALNRMTKAGMPESVRIAWKSSQLQGRSHEILFIQQSPQQKFDLFNKAVRRNKTAHIQVIYQPS